MLAVYFSLKDWLFKTLRECQLLCEKYSSKPIGFLFKAKWSTSLSRVHKGKSAAHKRPVLGLKKTNIVARSSKNEEFTTTAMAMKRILSFQSSHHVLFLTAVAVFLIFVAIALMFEVFLTKSSSFSSLESNASDWLWNDLGDSKGNSKEKYRGFGSGPLGLLRVSGQRVKYCRIFQETRGTQSVVGKIPNVLGK